MRIELHTNDESPRAMRHLAALLLALAGEEAPQRPAVTAAMVVAERDANGGTMAEAKQRVLAVVQTPQATVGINGASSEPGPDSPAGDPAGNEAGAEGGAATPAGDAPAATVTGDEKAKRTRRTKAEMEAARAAEAGNAGATSGSATTVAQPADGAASNTAEVAASDPANTAPQHTIDDVRAALQRYTEKHSMQHGISLLKNYGANRISELNADQYGLFIAECDAKE